MSFDVPLAKKTVATNGISISWLLVISMTITNGVSGDCGIAEKKAAMVSKIIAEAGAIGNQFTRSTTNPAPDAKIPQDMPLKKVAQSGNDRDYSEYEKLFPGDIGKKRGIRNLVLKS